MKLIGNLKNKVDKAQNKDEAKNLIAEAGMELTMDELEMVAGGVREEFGWVFQEEEHLRPYVGTE